MATFVWAQNSPQALLARWSNPRPGRDNKRFVGRIKRLNRSCFTPECEKQTTAVVIERARGAMSCLFIRMWCV